MPKEPHIDSKTDLCTGTDEHFHVVFKLPTTNFLSLFKDKMGDFDALRKTVHRLGCRCEEEDIVSIDIERVTDQYFGPGVMITVHETTEPYQSKCNKCNFHFDTGES